MFNRSIREPSKSEPRSIHSSEVMFRMSHDGGSASLEFFGGEPASPLRLVSLEWL